MGVSRQRLSEILLNQLWQLVESVGLRVWVDLMWRGDKTNTT